jgi:hypothetical protein
MSLLPYNPNSLGIGGKLLTIAVAGATGLPNGAAINGNAATDLLLFTSNHNLATGDKLVPTFSSGFTGLTNGTTYYAIANSATNVKVAATLADAVAGTAINIEADGTNGTAAYAGTSYRAMNWAPERTAREVSRTDEAGDAAEFTLRPEPIRQSGLQLQLATSATPAPRCGMEFTDPDDSTVTHVVTAVSPKYQAGELWMCEIAYRSTANQTD